MLDVLPELREHGPTFLLLGQRVTVGSGGRSLGLSLSDDVRLVDSAFNNLLLLRVKVLREVFVQSWLLLLKLCYLLAVIEIPEHM
jgi:hypothetical protein